MHIPDGFLDARTAIATAALGTTGLGIALRQARMQLPPRRVPLMGLAAAFIFAAQMVNFPIGAGTSGHLVGSVLAAVLLGPSAAAVVLSAVLIVQCFLFADGGVSALGANIFNMAIVGSIGGYAIYRAVHAVFGGPWGKLLAATFAAWCATVLSSICCAGELAMAGWPRIVLPAMANVHMIIGLGEGLITALVLTAIARTRPELLEEGSVPAVSSRYGEIAVYGLLIALGIALFLSPFASQGPDGLDRVAQRLGLTANATIPAAAPLLNYRIPGIASPAMATALAGAVGTIIAFVLALLLTRVLAPRSKPPAGPAETV